MKKVLVTGGAGFIGSHLVDHLETLGCEVMAYDCLHPQVHPQSPEWPAYMDSNTTKCWYGSVQDVGNVYSALMSFQPDTIIHLAARVGVGQSNYQIADYTSANVTGTAVLMSAIVEYNKRAGHGVVERAGLATADEEEVDKEIAEAFLDQQYPKSSIQQVFVAGSMSSYGEGTYDLQGLRHKGGPRYEESMVDGDWSASPGRPVGISEQDAFDPRSVYSMNKRDQEQLALMVGEIHGLDVRVGRFFNVYGTRQALSNPYTGVGAIFSARLLGDLPPIVYEDGEQSRDFIHVSDVCGAVCAILDHGQPLGSYNVGTGTPTSINKLALLIADHMGKDIIPDHTGQYRVGDIRHCYANVDKLKALGWAPKIALEDGVPDLVDWVIHQKSLEQGTLDRAHNELVQNNLLRGGA